MRTKKTLKEVLLIVLNYLKALLSMIFGFFFSFFSSKKSQKPESKLKKTSPKENRKKKLDSANEVPVKPNNGVKALVREEEAPVSFCINEDELEEYIKVIYAEMLETEADYLTDSQLEIILLVQEKIILPINKKIEKKEITNKAELKEELQIAIEEEIITILQEDNNYHPLDVLPVKEYCNKRKDKDIMEEIYKKNIVVKNATSPTVLKKSDLEEKELNASSNDRVVSVTNFEPNYKTPTNNTEVDYIPNVISLEKEVTKKTVQENSQPIVMPTQKVIIPEQKNGTLVLEALEEVMPKSEIDVLSPIEEPALDIDGTLTMAQADDARELAINIEPPLVEIAEDESITDAINTPDEEIMEEKAPNQDKVNNNNQLKEEEKAFYKVDFKKISLLVDSIMHDLLVEKNKRDLEDKDYDAINRRIEQLLNDILENKKQNLNSDTTNKLLQWQNKALDVKDKLDRERQNDIKKEEDTLQESISNSELNQLNDELKKMHLENQMSLNQYMLEKLEDLDILTKDKAARIEKELLKERLRKAAGALEISTLLSLPLLPNKYFLFFTSGLFISRHLGFFHNILRRKTVPFAPDEMDYVRTGSDALEEAFNKNMENINYLNFLENEALIKFPELVNDHEFLLYLNNLRGGLVLQSKQMMKKKQMIEKFNLKKSNYTRTLKKKNEAA